MSLKRTHSIGSAFWIWIFLGAGRRHFMRDIHMHESLDFGKSD